MTERYRVGDHGFEVPVTVKGEVEWLPPEVASYWVLTRVLAQQAELLDVLGEAVRAIPAGAKLAGRLAGLKERMKPHGRTPYETGPDPDPGPDSGPDPDDARVEPEPGVAIIEHAHPEYGGLRHAHVIPDDVVEPHGHDAHGAVV